MSCPGADTRAVNANECCAAPSRTVLLVEDDEGIRESVAECLSLEGYEVVLASDGAEALAWLRRGGRPGVVLLDMVMPVMSGTEVMERMRTDMALAAVPVVLMTAASQKPGDGAAAQAVLDKPFDMEQLLEAVERFCGPPAASP